MRNLVKKHIANCFMIYPSYGPVDDKTIDARVQIFLAVINHAGLTKEQVDQGFREYLTHGPSRFPMPSDICRAAEPVTMYRLDNGPWGFGGLYFREDEYAQQQIAAGVQIEARAVQVPAGEAATYRHQRIATERETRAAALPGPGMVLLGTAAGIHSSDED